MDRFLAVTDKDENYARRLCAFISEKRTVPFVPVSFRSVSDYLKFSGSHSISIHIFDGETFEEFMTEREFEEREEVEDLFSEEEDEAEKSSALSRELINDRTLFLYKSKLLDTVTEETLESMRAEGIYKYRSADEILRKAMEVYSRTTGRLKYVDNFGKTRIVGVYSPVGRSLKTTFSLLYCEAAAAKKKVLYINLEEFSGLKAFCGEEWKEDLSDVLYYLKEDSLDFPKLKSLVHSMRGFDFIPPVTYPEDAGSGEAGDYESLVECICEISDYELLVIDMQGFAGCASRLLEICDDIYVTVLDDPVSKEKLGAFESYMEASGRERTAERIKKIELPRESPEAMLPDYLDRLSYSAVGDYVRGLVS